jgi:hypothetical protein
MRYGAFLVMLSLLLGAGTARAQSPGVIPAPAQTEAKPAIKHVKRKPVAAKPAPAKTADVKLPPAKPAAIKPAETKPAEVKLPVAKPAEAKSAPKAVAVKPATPNAPAAKAEASPDAFSEIPSAERSKLQAALLWSGDYTGAAGGDDPMVTAIKNFQKRHKAKVTGELTSSERADLIAAAKAHEDEFGWSVVVDPATGIRIGLPAKLVPQARDAARGTRWSSAHGEVQVETFRIKNPGLTLAALFEREKTQPATRRVETSALHDDNFFISGMQGLKMFSVRAKMRGGEIRGFTMLYDQMMESIVAPAVAAMASAFSPFPERSAPYAALARSVEYGTGLVVSAQGHIVTDLRLTQGCQVIVAAGLGDADRVAEDPDNGLALLRVYGQRKISPLALTHDAPDGGKPRDVTLVGIPDPKEQDGSRKLTEIKARLSGGSAIELRQPVPMAGFSGAAALDARGQFLGMMAMSQAVLASVEASAPPVRLVSAGTIRGFLAAHHVATATPPSADAKASVVRVICVRK